MIKAIIFDFFGVLATRGLRQYKKTYFAGDQAKIKQGKELQTKLDEGSIGYDGYIDKLAAIGGTDRQTVLKHTENYKPNKKLLDYIKHNLKPKYQIGIISNAGTDWVQKILGQDGESLFDDIILSYQARLTKPQSRIYEISAKNLGVDSSECVFIDDIQTYCRGAENVGMNTVWYQNFDQMKQELEAILASVPND